MVKKKQKKNIFPNVKNNMKFNPSVHKYSVLEHSHASSWVYSCFHAATETLWLEKPKIFTIWLFTGSLLTAALNTCRQISFRIWLFSSYVFNL